MFLISGELRQGFLEYLYSRPYAEVAQGVQALEGLHELKTSFIVLTPDVKSDKGIHNYVHEFDDKSEALAFQKEHEGSQFLTVIV